MKFTQTIIVALPPESVFAFRRALANSPAWQRGVVSASLETPGPIRVGSRCTELRNGAQGAVDEWQLEVTEYEPGQVLGISGQWGLTRWEERHVFVTEGPSTRYTLSVEVTGSPSPPGAIQRQIVETMLQLKWALEAPSHRPS